MTHPRHPERLRAFIGALAELIDSDSGEADLLHRGGKLLGQLVRHDDWLPDEFAAPDPTRYQQILLHADARQRFSVVSFVWGPGQRTPIHDHRVWGLIGMLRGAEFSQGFARSADGRLEKQGAAIRLEPGHVGRCRRTATTFIRSATRSRIRFPSASMSTAPTSAR